MGESSGQATDPAKSVRATKPTDGHAARESKDLREATVTEVRMLSPSVRELTFDTGGEFDFDPGQWINLYMPRLREDDSEKPIKRAYSIASPPRADGRLQLAVTLVPGGPVSTFLHSIPVGTRVQISRPFGVFRLSPVVRPVIMIATGTGVAPFRSMLHVASKLPPTQPVALLLGIRTLDDVLYGDEFVTMTRAWSTFGFHPTLSRGPDQWSGRRGHVQTHLHEIVASLCHGSEVDAYICGLSKMVHEVRRILGDELHIPKSRVHFERYD